ncbi:MAG: FG-GAP repeat domain-containing protein, partial [Cytophagales bacterium]
MSQYAIGSFDIQDYTTGDFNADGLVDMAIANGGAGGLPIILASSTSGFGVPNFLPTVGSPKAIVSADFNGDGKLDIATAGTNIGGWVSMHMGNGMGGFSGFINYNVGDNPNSLEAGDFNDDGFIDLVSANFGSNNISLLINNGNGGFFNATNISVGSQPSSVKVGDFNQDGLADIAVVNSNSTNLSILLNSGNANFTNSALLTVGINTVGLTISDFDSDGILDLAVVNFITNSIPVFKGVGNGTFTNLVNIPSVNGNNKINSGDFDGDGDADLLVSNTGLDRTVRIFLNDGIGNFNLNKQESVFPQLPVGVEIADFNNDGKADFVTGSTSSFIFKYDPPITGIFRSKATGNWSNPAIWEVSTNTGLSFQSTSQYPGQLTPFDEVSIAGGNVVDLDVAPSPLVGLTIAGASTFDVQNAISISGITEVLGTWNRTASIGDSYFGGELKIYSFNGFRHTATSHNYIFSNGISLIGAGSLNLGTMGNARFVNNNQTLTGGSFVFGDQFTIENVEVTLNGQMSGFSNLGNRMNGTSASSKFELAPNSTLNYAAQILPMQSGLFVVSASGSSVNYNRSGAQPIYATVYHNLNSFISGVKTLTGNTSVLNNIILSATTNLIFPTTTTSLEVFNNISVLGVLDMTHGLQPHQLRLGGGFSVSGTYLPGFGITEYFSTSPQNIKTGSYYGLKLSGGSAKTALGNIEVNSNLTLSGALFDIGSHSLNITNSQILSAPGFDFGINNMIATDNNLGFVFRDNSCNPCNGNGVYPFGILSPLPKYLPINVKSYDFTDNSNWMLRPFSGTALNGSSDFISRQFEIQQTCMTACNVGGFQFEAAFDPTTDLTGQPNVVFKNTSGADNGLLNYFINTTNGLYGISSPTTGSLNDGIYYATKVNPKLYVSKTDGNWSSPAIWNVSTDSGVSFFNATDYPGQFLSFDVVSITGATNVT